VTNVADTAPASGQVQPPARTSIRGLIAQTEIDLRLFGMLLALGVILLTFNILSGGKFFQPTNMVTLAVQASGVAVIATGMVLVIVSRNIDLSVGSLVGVIAMTYALLMTDWMPNILGMGPDFPFRWLIALGLGIGLGALVGGLQGFIIAYIGVPSFIVTLGGLLSIRGVVWYLSSGAARSGLDPNFQLIGGGAQGSIGGTLTWILALVGCVAIVVLLLNGRRQRRRFDFPLRPVWAEVMLGVLGCAAVVAVAAFANANLWPQGLAARIAARDNWGPTPEGGWQIPTGFPYPMVLLLGVTLVMAWLATRRRFGRYVYAYGGNPDAAELAKILENVFRNVNIALVNQLALLCERMGLDVWEVIDAAATKPFGFMRFTPGPGVGGHCIPVDPYYLSWRAREFDFVDRFVELAGDINLAMPRHVVSLVGTALNEHGRAVRGSRVAILGVAFKPDVRDPRNSPAAEILAGLAELGAIVEYHDPHVERFRDAAGALRESRPLDEILGEADVVVVVTPHRAIDWERVYDRAPLIVDTTDSSRGRVRRERQVLRLGAGWTAPTA